MYYLLLRWAGRCFGGTTSWTTYWLIPPDFTRSPTQRGTKKSHDIPENKEVENKTQKREVTLLVLPE